MTHSAAITVERLRQLEITYDPQTGMVMRNMHFTYGDVERLISGERYHLGNQTIPVARIAWMLYHGRTLQPWQQVKQRNGNKRDHRIENLYMVDLAQAAIAAGELSDVDRLTRKQGERPGQQEAVRLRDVFGGSLAHYMFSMIGNKWLTRQMIESVYLNCIIDGDPVAGRWTWAQSIGFEGETVLFLREQTGIKFQVNADNQLMAVEIIDRLASLDGSEPGLPA